MPFPDTLLYLFRAIVCIFAILSLVKLYEVALYGRLITATLARPSFDKKLADCYVYLHRNRADEIFWITVATIGIVEMLGRFALHSLRYTPLFWIHIIFFAVPFFFLLCLIKFKFTGLRNKSFHKRYAPWCVGLGVGANVLGAVLVFTIP